ncbi:phosphatase PAP2 family protein [Emydomyces testavorans]|uniref:Dolichyldiphosphatase n=1 Tax=Emydomyces testavorans TaxID=2070801 RepID=A0AAF0DN89_9EURO|nr:phosphatase PAP2 family protein [Emydomyces testavorans]
MDENKMEMPLASFSLTHVHYNPEDPLSYLCAFLSLVPQALVVIYITLIWSSREVEVLLMFAGQMLCEALNFSLKRLIQEERPHQIYGKGYGMPSSHSQFVAFFAFSVTLFLLFRHNPTTSSTLPNDSPSTFTQRVAMSLLACLGAAAVASSRVYLHYHSAKQVLVGVLAGSGFALVWYLLGAYLRMSGWIEWFLEAKIPRSLRMRDLLMGEDLAEAGWQRWKMRQRAFNRAKKFS